MKPFLRWPGGKRKIAKVLVDEILSNTLEVYIEPFCGSAAVGLELASRRCGAEIILTDSCQGLITTYTEIRKNPLEVQRGYDALRDQVSKEDYYNTRDKYNHGTTTPTESAVYFLYLNALCHNGLHRVNSKGEFNVPRGDKKDLPDRDFSRISKELQEGNVGFCRVDFKTILSITGGLNPSGIRIFCDPPYPDSFTAYTSEGFSMLRHKMLSESLRRLHKAGAKIWATIGEDPIVRGFYEPWADIEIMEEVFKIGGVGSRRKPKNTMLIRA